MMANHGVGEGRKIPLFRFAPPEPIPFQQLDSRLMDRPCVLECFLEPILRLGRVVPNRIEDSLAQGSANNGPTLVATGRLVAVKGYNLLILAFARVIPCHADWCLSIWGDVARSARH